MRRAIYALLILLLAAPVLVQTQKKHGKPIHEGGLIIGGTTPDTPTAGVTFRIVGAKTTVEVHSDGRVTWDKVALPEAAQEFWRELAKLAPTFQPTERIQATDALELALSHLKPSSVPLGVQATNAIYLTPDTPIQALRRQADAIEKRDADIRTIVDVLDRLRKSKEQ